MPIPGFSHRAASSAIQRFDEAKPKAQNSAQPFHTALQHSHRTGGARSQIEETHAATRNTGWPSLDERLEALDYQHVLVDDPYLAQLNLDTTVSTVREWLSDLRRSVDTELVPADIDPDLAGAQRWAFAYGLTHTPYVTSAAPVIESPALDGLDIDM